jgi:hypothetical protein
MTDPPSELHLAHMHNRLDPRRNDMASGLAHRRCNIGDAGRLALERLRGRDPKPRPRTKW